MRAVKAPVEMTGAFVIEINYFDDAILVSVDAVMKLE
jgi:hypothetical protein